MLLLLGKEILQLLSSVRVLFSHAVLGRGVSHAISLGLRVMQKTLALNHLI